MKANTNPSTNNRIALSGLLIAAALGASNGTQAQTEDPTICKVGVNVTVIEPDCGVNNGTVIFLAFDGIAPYTFILDGVPVTGEYSGLSSGYHQYMIIDQLGCFVEGEFTVECEENCFYNTFTQGGWGAVPEGNNPGTYLHAHFAEVYPAGLTIGCDRILRLTTAQAVTNFLPSGSTPKKLQNAIYTNPGAGYRNVLAGQLVAATLNVGFDAADPDFNPSDVLLGDLEIASGPFAGWTVNELLAAANLFIGNCSSPYTASALNTALTNVNESFSGAGASGYLLCPLSGDNKSIQFTVQAAETGTMHLYPVPAQDVLNVSLPDGVEFGGMVRILDLSGRVVAEKGRQQWAAGSVNALDVSGLPEGAYLLTVELDHKRIVKTFTVVR